MWLIRNPEVRGVLIIILLILVVGFILAASTGKLEKWFGVTWFSGARALDKIVFVSDRSGSPQLYIMNTNGSGQKALTTHASVLSAPAISPNGTRIAFIGLVDSWPQVMTVGGEGGTPEQLTASTTPKSIVSYTPNGEKLAFIASGRVYAAEANGDNPDVVLPTEEEIHQAMTNPLLRGESTPAYHDYAWGPDSVKIAGVTKDASGDDVLVYVPKPDAEPFRFPQPQQGRVKIAGIAWAADKPILAASFNIEKNGWLVLYDARAKRLGAAEFKGQELGKPAVSPDGTRIVVPYKELKTKQAVLAGINAETGGREVIASGEFHNPAFSPDGDTILAVQSAKGGKSRDVVTIDMITGKLKKLTKDGKSFDAIWTPVSND